ncbi:MAG: exo-alpha-sialidase [Chloroflexi bacterium]|nr:exo-alpha-sialidase [Chloroflexota bacterium]
MILVPSTPEYPRNDEASAVLLADGGMLVVWSRFKHLNRGSNGSRAYDPVTGLPGTALNSDNASSDIAAIETHDGGHTWSPPRTLITNTAGLNVMNPGLARLSNGNLGLLYNFRESTISACRLYRTSSDEGHTWSEPVALTSEGYQTGCNDRLTVLSSGRLLTALHVTDDWHSHHLFTRVARSDDHGQTWSFSDSIELPPVSSSGESGAWEGDLVERADGSVLLVLRTAMGTLFRAESHDSGATWTELRSLEVVSPVAPAVIRRIPGSDRLLLIWNWNYNVHQAMAGTRCPLAYAVSDDHGASWPHLQRHTLEDDPEFTWAYPSCTFVGGEAWITYYESRADDPFGPRSLKLRRLPVDSLLEGS